MKVHWYSVIMEEGEGTKASPGPKSFPRGKINAESSPGPRNSPRIKNNAQRSSIAALKAARRAEMEALVQEEAEMKDLRLGQRRGPTGLAYDSNMLLHRCDWDPEHIENPGRLERVIARCTELGLVDRCITLPSREAQDAELLLYHDQNFLDILHRSRTQTVEESETVCQGFDSVFLCPDTDRAARLATGGAVDLVQAVLAGTIHNGMGVVRPPGHHAMASTLCGFCGFNNVVIAAKSALATGVKRILIVDFDLHHGQGTQQAFYSDPRVLYMSVHRYELGQYWPHLRESNFDYVGEGGGKGFNVNVALNSIGCGPADYLSIFQSVFLPIAAEFQPQLVLVSAGYDAAVGCPEGEMLVTPATYPHLLHQLSGLAGGRLVSLLEGGYCLDSLAEAAALSLRELLGDCCPALRGGGMSVAVQDSVRAAVTALRPYWRCLAHWHTADPATYTYNPETVFCPDLTFCPPSDWPPAEFPTRDYYLVYSPAVVQEWTVKVAAIVLNTELRAGRERLAVFYDPAMERHEDDEPHPECPERISRIYGALVEAGVMERKEVRRLETGRQLTQEEAELVHDASHWERLQEQQLVDQEERDEIAEKMNSIYLNSHSLECGLLAAGGVLAAVDRVLANGEEGSLAGLAVVRPPGHHAEPDTPHGFCLFNNVAIAAEYAVRQHGLQRVLVLDWDVHHGNGIQHMFYGSRNVLYISMHRYDYGSFFPQSEDANYDMVGEGAGEGFNVNIPFNGRKMGDSEYLLAFQSLVLPIAYQFQPELVLVSAGFDAADGDPLGGYKVSPAMYGYMTQGLLSLAQGRLVVALEGGYCLPVIAEAVLQCARAMLGDPLPGLSLQTEEIKQSAVETVRNVIKAQAPYWSCLAQYSKTLPESLELHLELAQGELPGVKVSERLGEEIQNLDRSFRRLDLVMAEREDGGGDGGSVVCGEGNTEEPGAEVEERQDGEVEKERDGAGSNVESGVKIVLISADGDTH